MTSSSRCSVCEWGKLEWCASSKTGGRSEGVEQPHLNAARGMALHPTQFREVYGRLNYMTAASWRNKVHTIIGNGVATVLAEPPDDFAGTFVVKDFAAVMARLWEVALEAIYADGQTISTIYDMSTGMATPAADHRIVFPAPFGNTGLWPAHHVDLTDDRSCAQ